MEIRGEIAEVFWQPRHLSRECLECLYSSVAGAGDFSPYSSCFWPSPVPLPFAEVSLIRRLARPGGETGCGGEVRYNSDEFKFPDQATGARERTILYIYSYLQMSSRHRAIISSGPDNFMIFLTNEWFAASRILMKIMQLILENARITDNKEE